MAATMDAPPRLEGAALAWRAVQELTCRLETRWAGPMPDTRVFHGWQPLPAAEFLPVLERAGRETPGRRFCDLGCGIGSKLVLALALGWQVSGVERHRPYLDAARDLVPEAELVEAEIGDLDSFEADLLYMYRPYVQLTDQQQLERYVVDRCHPGTLLFLPGRPGASIDAEQVTASLWRL
jgi:SAM-dependent methyltransferase